MIIPKGSDTLEYGDIVVVVTTAVTGNKITSLEDIFEKGH
jgi:Trk K+ transport system NAD-binding subunit